MCEKRDVRRRRYLQKPNKQQMEPDLVITRYLDNAIFFYYFSFAFLMKIKWEIQFWRLKNSKFIFSCLKTAYQLLISIISSWGVDFAKLTSESSFTPQNIVEKLVQVLGRFNFYETCKRVYPTMLVADCFCQQIASFSLFWRCWLKW